MNDLEDRLGTDLAELADRGTPSQLTTTHVLGRVQQRRRRRTVARGVAACAVVVVVVAGVGAITGRDTDSTAAEQPDVVERLLADGNSVSGFVQIEKSRADRNRCDMILEEVASGERIELSEDRGALARGCMLDLQALARAEMLGSSALRRRPDVFVVNRFSKAEAQGGGFRALVTTAIELNIPCLIAVSARNLDAWRYFTAGMSTEVAIQELASDAGFAGRHLRLTSHRYEVASDEMFKGSVGEYLSCNSPSS